ncbi:hypothetical protein TIFTF001_031130 [Ficus carica]|uniref:Uncharacterized protein n=1 Tax=Ficus carica TaxID=3494 RepID=A0AA88J526_FICCA|nr:hypothetical protein TIFTF001_031130 [Ficus carica]
MASSEFFLFSLLLALTFTASRGDPPLRNGGDSSDSYAAVADGVEFELLESKIASLDSSIDERNRELREKEESFAVMQKMIQDKLEVISSLRSEIELLQESLDGKEDTGESDRQTGELEKQVERLRKDIEIQNNKKEGLGARASVAQKKMKKLNSKLVKLHTVNEEQENRIRKTEHLLQVAEEELMKAEVETASISIGLNKAYGEWLPDWLSIHLDHIQFYMMSSWNESWGPAVNLSLQKALEKKAQVVDWIKLQIEMIIVDWVPIMKEQWSAFLTLVKPHVQSLRPKIADLYHSLKSYIGPHAVKVLKDLLSYPQASASENHIPILKEQWSEFISSSQPRLQLLIERIVDEYHASKSFIEPHAVRALKVLNWSTQVAKKFTGTFMYQIVILTRSCLYNVYFAWKWYAINVFRACWKLITFLTSFHHQVQEMLKNTAFLRPVTRMEVAWFVATAFLALPALFLFILYSTVFRRKAKKQIQNSNTNHTRRRSKQAHLGN